MPLHALTDAAEITDAYHTLVAQLTEAAEPFPRFVGWQGGGGTYTIHWHPQLPLWSLHEELENGYRWFGLGTNDPNESSFGSISAQISFNYEGMERRRSGVFARNDTDGRLFLVHNGNIRDNSTGGGRNEFLEFYYRLPSSNFINVYWPNQKKGIEYINFGAIEDAEFLPRLTAFVRQVESFKNRQ